VRELSEDDVRELVAAGYEPRPGGRWYAPECGYAVPARVALERAREDAVHRVLARMALDAEARA
jgi:hypothetical protein